MSMSQREFITVLHGGLGILFLLAYAGGVYGLYSLRPGWLTTTGMQVGARWLRSGTILMAIVAWATVFLALYVVFPWYRTAPPQGTTDLTMYPRYLLVANPATAAWHTFGMEVKEHTSWITPILATAVAYIVHRYRTSLATQTNIRSAITVLFTVAFLVAAVAGLLGALITKVAPIK